MPCFASGADYATNHLRQRFQLQLSEAEAEGFVDDVLIQKSLGSYFTRMVLPSPSSPPITPPLRRIALTRQIVRSIPIPHPGHLLKRVILTLVFEGSYVEKYTTGCAWTGGYKKKSKIEAYYLMYMKCLRLFSLFQHGIE